MHQERQTSPRCNNGNSVSLSLHIRYTSNAHGNCVLHHAPFLHHLQLLSFFSLQNAQIYSMHGKFPFRRFVDIKLQYPSPHLPMQKSAASCANVSSVNMSSSRMVGDTLNKPDLFCVVHQVWPNVRLYNRNIMLPQITVCQQVDSGSLYYTSYSDTYHP
jgi:hypothetical protein